MNNKKGEEESSWRCNLLNGLFEVGSAFFVTLFGLSLIIFLILLATRFF